jgi:hypothetical protein
MKDILLDLYTDYLISSNHYRTATGLSAILDGEVSHDKITRFLARKNYSSKALWGFVKPNIRELETEDGVLIFDDTLEAKPYTDENELICWHYDHVSGKNMKGVNILSALVRYGDTALPIAFETVVKPILYCDIKTKKVKRLATQTKNEMFRNMVSQSIKNKVKYNYVLADSWYSSKENMEHVLSKEKHFIFALKSNRTIAITKEEKHQGKFKKLSEVELEENTAIRAYVKGLSVPVMIVKQIFKNKDGSTGVLYLACSDLSLDFHCIINLYQKRWKVEEYHKSIKSNAGLEKSPTRTVRTQSNHIFSTICAYIKLEKLSIKKSLNHFALKYKLIVSANRLAFSQLQKMKGNLAHA